MKILVTIVLIIFLNNHLSAQVKKNIAFDLKLKDLNDRMSGSRDTVTLADEDSFMLRVDYTDFDTTAIRTRIHHLYGEEKDNITDDIHGKVFELKSRKSFTIEFSFCEWVEIQDQMQVQLVRIGFDFDSTYRKSDGKDTVVVKNGVIEFEASAQADSIVSLNARGMRIRQVSQPTQALVTRPKMICKEEKTVTIVFRKKDAEKTETQKQIEGLNNRITAILDQQPENVAIGELILQTTDVSIKDKSGKEIKKAKVAKIEITFAHGSIARRGLRVEMNDGSIFFNQWAPINLPRFNKRKKDHLKFYDERSDRYIELGDVLDYHYFGPFHYPADDVRKLDADNPRDTLRVGSSLNDLIDLSIYTDLLGLLGRKANGLIQTEVSGNFISNSGNVRDNDIVFHNFMRPYIRLSKYDSKFSSLDSTKVGVGVNGRDTVNRTYLNQISYLQAGILINIVRFGLGVNQLFYISGGADINLVNADSIYGKDVIFFNYYPEVHYSITRLKNFGMDCSVRFLRQRIGDNSPFVNREAIWIFKPQITLFYYPSKDQGSKIYLRFNYFDNLSTSSDNFTQFQLGYKTTLKFKSN